MLSLKNIRASLASFIQPRASLPSNGTELPQVKLLSQPIAPSASSGPGTITAGNPPELNSLIQAIATVRRSLPKAQSRPAAALPGHATRPAPRAAAPASTDDDPPQPDTSGLDGVIASLMDSVEKLKAMLPSDVVADDGDEAQAKAYLAIGNKKAALACISRAHTAVGAQVAAQKSRSALRAMPSSRERAAKLTASGFNEMPAVAALNSLLGRGGPSLKSRSEMVLAPVGGTRTPAPATASPSDYRARVQAIRAEREALDVQMRKTGVYDAKSLARQGQLKAELTAIMKANRPQ